MDSLNLNLEENWALAADLQRPLRQPVDFASSAAGFEIQLTSTKKIFDCVKCYCVKGSKNVNTLPNTTYTHILLILYKHLIS